MTPLEAIVLLNAIFGLATRVTEYVETPASTPEEELARWNALKARVLALHTEVMAYQPLLPPGRETVPWTPMS